MGSEQELRNLVISCRKMGEASYAQGNLEKTYEYYRMALERGQQLCRQSEDINDRAENLPGICEKMAEVCCRLNYLGEAVEYFRLGMELRQGALGMLHQKDWITGVKRQIVWDCRQMVSIYEEMCDEENVVKYCRVGLPISAELYNTGRTEGDGHLFTSFAQRLGSFCYLAGDLEQAFGYFQDVLTVRRYLRDEDRDVRTRGELAVNYEFLGHIYYQKEDYEHAAECYMQELEIHKRIFQEVSTVDHYGKCAWSYYHLSTALDDAGEFECLKNAIAILEDILNRFPEAYEAGYKRLGMQCLGKIQRFNS